MSTSLCGLSIRFPCGACVFPTFTLVYGRDPEEKFSAAVRHFTLKVKPILSQKCFSCHGDDPDEIEGGLIMTSRDDLLLGGDGFRDVLVPGDAEASFMMTAVRWEDPDYEMPPKENDRLTAEQIWALRDWINAGAPWPDDVTQAAIRDEEAELLHTGEGIIVKTSGALSEDWAMRRYQPENIWAYHELEVVEPPGNGHPIDAFIDQALEERGLEPAPLAEPRTLIRRVTFDLTGLPPSPEEVDAFSQAWAEEPVAAYEGLVDRLLASPHYGERQAQHWLDVTRYADTDGGSNDYERSGIWRYRDYVLRCFNEDKPYNEFVVEQIAGDILRPDDAETKVAVGFLRMGPWEATTMNPPAIIRQQFLDDVVNHVGEVFLAQPLRCAKCHDHKFDP